MITTLNHAAARSAAANPVQSDLTPDADAGRPTQGSVPEAPRLNLVADESSDYDPVAVAAASGVGARITLAVLADDYVRLITEALAATNSADLLLDTDRVSTFVRGSEQRIAEYLRELIAAASTSGHHLVAHLLLSRGCPGEVCGPVPPPAGDSVRLAVSGVWVQAQWSLYPLADPGAPALADGADHLAPVWAAIERARQDDTFLRSEHFATTMAGDLSNVLGTVFRTWSAAGAAVAHVVSHLTLSVHSPSENLR